MPWIEEERPDDVQVRTVASFVPMAAAAVRDAERFRKATDRIYSTIRAQMDARLFERLQVMEHPMHMGHVHVAMNDADRIDRRTERWLPPSAFDAATLRPRNGDPCPNCGRLMQYVSLTDRYECPVSGLTADAS